MTVMTRWAATAVLMAGTLMAAGPLQGAPAGDVSLGLTVDRVVILMRHGVRPPTKSPPMPDGVTPDRWPDWPVKPGWLTPHGAQAISRIGAYDAALLRGWGVLPRKGCPVAGTVAVIADSDQRTIATGDAWREAVGPGCAIPSEHKPQDESDPLFGAIGAGLTKFDPARATAEVEAAAGPGGIVAVEATYRPLLQRIDAILCGAATTSCGVGHEPSGIVPAKTGAKPKLSGALDRASTVAQILLLEYAEGKPMADVGWGRATAVDVANLSAFHALEFKILARPSYVAARNLAGLTPRILAALSGEKGGAAVTMISGHDTNVANLGGLLDIHWQVPGLAADDPAPGGAIVLERLKDKKGALYVRAVYRGQTLDQIRAAADPATNPPYRAVLPVPGCKALGVEGLCTLADMQAKLGTAL
jgi:4-phytase/acid phosphatase